MLHRFALALGLLFLGILVGRETARAQARVRPKRARALHSARLLTLPTGKASVH